MEIYLASTLVYGVQYVLC